MSLYVVHYHHSRHILERYHVLSVFFFQEITLELSVETLGWIGFGVSPNGAMAGADILTGWVDEDGVGHIQVGYLDS